MRYFSFLTVRAWFCTVFLTRTFHGVFLSRLNDIKDTSVRHNEKRNNDIEETTWDSMRRDETVWYTIVVFGSLTETCEAFAKKISPEVGLRDEKRDDKLLNVVFFARFSHFFAIITRLLQKKLYFCHVMPWFNGKNGNRQRNGSTNYWTMTPIPTCSTRKHKKWKIRYAYTPFHIRNINNKK